ncbi:MAG: DUF1614 domain-containing protein [Chloroflexi bacterium]|nr:DUF1614 domain-containing protein [Chloroflexota bacterium]
MGCRALIFLALLALPVLLLAVFFQVAAISFERLGLTAEAGVLLFLASLTGSVVNIPVSRRRIVVREARQVFLFRFLFYYPPQVQEQIIFVNLGGAVIPTLFSLYLLTRTPLAPLVAATAIVTLAAYLLARPMPGVGIVMPAFLPPLVAAGVALLIARGDAAPVAYVSGVLGTLIGADLLHLGEVRRMGAQAMSIGGAGVFDGIFLVGVIAVLLT